MSELVENYFLSVTRPVQRNNILDLMDRLEPPVPRGREAGIAGANDGGSAVKVKEGGGYGI